MQRTWERDMKESEQKRGKSNDVEMGSLGGKSAWTERDGMRRSEVREWNRRKGNKKKK